MADRLDTFRFGSGVRAMITDLTALAGDAVAEEIVGDSAGGRDVWHAPLVRELTVSLDTWEGGVGTADGGTAVTP